MKNIMVIAVLFFSISYMVTAQTTPIKSINVKEVKASIKPKNSKVEKKKVEKVTAIRSNNNFKEHIK